MTQQVRNPPAPEEQASSSPSASTSPVSKKAIVVLLVLVGMLFLLFTGQLFWSLSQVVARRTSTVPRPTPTVNQNKDVGPLLPPGQATAPQLTLPSDKYIVYQQSKGISIVPLAGGLATALTTPGYIYNLSAPPLITPSGQLLYSGNGLWLTDIFNGMPTQIATLPAGQVITSMILSSDGTTIAWSTEPANGTGNTVLYAGPLEKSVPIYQHDATDCPCYRVFSFWQGKGVPTNSTVLLTDDRGNHQAIHYGLWSLNLTDTPLTDPQELLADDASQGPLTLSSDGTTLLYSTKQDVIPETDDSSVPRDISTLNYANSLSLAHIGVSSSSNHELVLQNTSAILPEQHDLSNNAAYHWVTTPTFAPDGHTLLYIVFSSDAQTPFDRHNAVYLVHTRSSGGQPPMVGTPQLLANSTDLFVELGTWISNARLTFYSDGMLYVLDTSNGAVATITKTGGYARVIAVVQGGNA